MKNEQISYYEQHNILPEHQNIENIEVHYARRNKLYRQCGIPEIAFRNAEMLEVGPGGGYNTLAFFHWNCKHIDLVEANSKGISDMQSLFSEHKIRKEQYELFEGVIEEYSTNKKYDIIIAEGFLPFISNKVEIIEKLKKLIKNKGIIVITCSDRIGLFIEIIKKLTATVLAKDILVYEEKVNYLTAIFKPQLEKLRGVSKLPEHWVMDNLLNTEIHNGNELTLSQAIQYFGDEFEVLGTSPRMFTDYSWSKDIWYEYKSDYLEQFDKKRLSLLMANMPEVILPMDKADMLVKCFMEIDRIASECIDQFETGKVKDIIDLMNSMNESIKKYFNDEFIKVFYEIEEILLRLYRGERVNMKDFTSFFKAFGRTQQYISFERK